MSLLCVAVMTCPPSSRMTSSCTVMLSGFWVHDDLSTTEVSLDTWPGWDPSAEVAEEIGRELQDLLDERPDAAELLRGRTFARSLQ